MSARPKLVERKSLTTQVAEALRDMILSGEFKQGEQLRQDDVAGRLGVSRNPVREAFQQLEAGGLLVNVPYKGAVVTRLSRAEIEEYFDIRATLEADLLMAAIDKMTPAHITKARKTLERMHQASPIKYGELNWELHADLYSAAQRPITLEFVKKIHDNLDRYVRLQLSISEANRSRADKEHARLIDLCEEGRKNEATGLLKDHVTAARNDLLECLDDNSN